MAGASEPRLARWDPVKPKGGVYEKARQKFPQALCGHTIRGNSAGDSPMTVRPPTIVFCLPGNSFSGRFLECWTNLLAWCLSNGIRFLLSRKYSNNVYYSRNLCLGGDVTRGPQQKPFDGQIDYSHIMWIDSDILFTPEQFARLVSHDVDIVSGIYLMEGGPQYATVKEWDEEYFEKNGCFRFLTPQDIDDAVPRQCGNVEMKNGRSCNTALPHQRNTALLEVAYTGMGFMLVKRGVFESLEYPWFRPIEKRIGNMVDFTTEDVSFCLRARERGWKVLADMEVKVGHEKAIVLLGQ